MINDLLIKSHDDEYREYLASKQKTEPICKNCKHWRQSKEAVNFGTCLMCEIRTCNTKIEMMHSSCGLKTYKYFGCNQFSHG